MVGEQMTTGNGSTGFRDTWLISYGLEKKWKLDQGFEIITKFRMVTENGGGILEQETKMEEKSLEIIFEEMYLAKGI